MQAVCKIIHTILIISILEFTNFTYIYGRESDNQKHYPNS